MKREISSLLTPVLRIVLPALFILSAVVFPTIIFFNPTVPNRAFSAVMAFMAFSILAGLVMLTTFWYRRVRMDEGKLFISNYLKEVSIPVSNILDVTERRLRGRPVTIHLKEASEFGQKITFLAKSRSIVGELKGLAGIEKGTSDSRLPDRR
ncbi:MAG: hypothetical protein PSX80_07720 [bacterium]|nr:hypothetical protein [bacterium]